MPPYDCAECGLNPTSVCGVELGWPPIVCYPIGLMFPTGPKDGLVPSCCKLEPEKARSTFCGPSGVLAFQFHSKGRSIEFLGVGLEL